MPLLTAAVVVLAVLVLINFVLLAAVIRRLNSYETTGPPPAAEAVGIGIGQPVPGFQTVAADGSRFTADGLQGSRTLVGFFSSTCRPCAAEAAVLAEQSPDLTGRGIAVWPVLTLDGGSDELLPILEKAAPVLTEPRPGPLTTAFDVRATPMYVLVGADGRVAGKGGSIDECIGAGPS